MPATNEKQPSRLQIYISDITKIHGCSDTTASRKLQQVRTALAKKEHQVVSISEYCEYWSIDYKTTLEFLKLL